MKETVLYLGATLFAIVIGLAIIVRYHRRRKRDSRDGVRWPDQWGPGNDIDWF